MNVEKEVFYNVEERNSCKRGPFFFWNQINPGSTGGAGNAWSGEKTGEL